MAYTTLVGCLVWLILSDFTIFAAEDVDSYVAQAEASMSAGDMSQAIAAYEKALEINPTDSSLYAKLGKACVISFQQSRGTADAADYLYKARDAFNKAIQFNSSNADAYVGRGIVFSNMANPEQALADLTKAIEIDPNNALAYKNRGDIFYGMNRDEQAISDYTKALGIQPDFTVARAALQNAKEAVDKTKNDQKAWDDGHSPEGFDAKVEESRQRAYQAYPDVQDNSTAMAQRVSAAVKQLSQTNPDFFHDSDWPMKITRAVAEQMKKEQSDANAANRAQIDQRLKQLQTAIDSDVYAMDQIQQLGGRRGQSYADLESKARELQTEKEQLIEERGQPASIPAQGQGNGTQSQFGGQGPTPLPPSQGGLQPSGGL